MTSVERLRWWRKHNPGSVRAHKAVQRALANGKIAKPEACSKCNKSGILHAHHEDYSKLLDIIWLCGACHAKTMMRWSGFH